MKKGFFLSSFFLLLSLFCLCTAIDEEFVVVDTAERFFKALRDGEYSVAWGLLTPKSKEIIINRVHSSLKKEGIKAEKEEIRRDFEGGGPLFKAYWKGFCEEFRPGLVLDRCRWELKEVKSRDKAVILLRCRATRPLKLFFLEGKWLVGFEESF